MSSVYGTPVLCSYTSYINKNEFRTIGISQNLSTQLMLIADQWPDAIADWM